MHNDLLFVYIVLIGKPGVPNSCMQMCVSLQVRVLLASPCNGACTK